jgi:hypothetical protein
VAVQTSTITAMGPGITAQTLTGNLDNSSGGPSYVGSVTVVVDGDAQGAWTGATIAFANDPALPGPATKTPAKGRP